MSKGILKGKKGIVFLLILSMMATVFTMTSFASSYKLTIENTEEYSFDPAKAAEGYNNLIVYTGVAYNTLDVKMKKYEITTILNTINLLHLSIAKFR